MVQRVTTGHKEEKVRSAEWEHSVHGRWQQKGQKTSRKNIWSFHSSSGPVHWSVCSCTVCQQCESCTPLLNTSLFFLPTQLWPSSALLPSLPFTYLGARRGANVLVVTSSWSGTSSCPLCQLIGLLLLLMEPWSALIHYWSNTACGGQESFKTAFQDACRCRKFKMSLFLSVYSQTFSPLA